MTQPETSNSLRDWLREVWPYLAFDAVWLAVGVYLLRKARR